MELRFLSSDEEDLVDPDEDKIEMGLTRLPDFSDGAPARAVLIHDNGKDFIQYVAKTKGGPVRNCHVQYCEYLEDGVEFRQYFTEKKTIEQVIKLFQRYAAGDPKWQGRIGWEPYEPKRTYGQMMGLIALISIGILFCGVGVWMESNMGLGGAIVSLCIGLAGLSSIVWIRPARAGVPWAAATGSTLFGGGGGCGSGSGSCSGDGSCGGSGGGSGGGDGGGGGGGGGCGGCGGGGD